MPKYTYHVIEDDPNLEDPIEIEMDWGYFNPNDEDAIDEYDLERLAKECAKNYYFLREAYRDERWPLTFAIEDNKGNRLGKVCVSMEYSPTFCGSVIHE